MNDYFSSIGSTLANKIRDLIKPKLTKTTATSPHSFNFKDVDEMSVLQELSKLRTNKATGLGGICAKLQYHLIGEIENNRFYLVCSRLVLLVSIKPYPSNHDQQFYVPTKVSNCRSPSGKYWTTSLPYLY
jgi:hypothetical protein